MTAGPEVPDGCRIRPPTTTDAEALSELINASSVGEGGVAVTTPEEVRDELREPDRVTDIDNAIVVDESGRMVGYLSLDVTDPVTEIVAQAFVHPEVTGRGIGSFLIRLGEERARMKLDRSPPRRRVVVRLTRWVVNEEARQLFEEHGYRFARRFWHMRIDLEDSPSQPRFPEGIDLRAFDRERDDRAVHAMLVEAFGEHWGQAIRPFTGWVATTIDGEAAAFDPDLWSVAWHGQEIVGAAICRMGSWWDPRMGWVDGLGVRPGWRERGLGSTSCSSRSGASISVGFVASAWPSTRPTPREPRACTSGRGCEWSGPGRSGRRSSAPGASSSGTDRPRARASALSRFRSPL